MTDHVYRKYPNHIRAINALLQYDATFREICADYEEMCTWLACEEHAKGRPAEEYDRARMLIRDLEYEINRVLRDEGF